MRQGQGRLGMSKLQIDLRARRAERTARRGRKLSQAAEHSQQNTAEVQRDQAWSQSGVIENASKSEQSEKVTM